MPLASCTQLIKSCAAREPTRDESKAALKVLAAGGTALKRAQSPHHSFNCCVTSSGPEKLADLRPGACLQSRAVMPL